MRLVVCDKCGKTAAYDETPGWLVCHEVRICEPPDSVLFRYIDLCPEDRNGLERTIVNHIRGFRPPAENPG